jgi:uncharacterized Fe-S cluster-containing MiaB family protein
MQCFLLLRWFTAISNKKKEEKMENTRCKENCCDGHINANNFTILQVGGCSISSLAYYCDKCGRLHRWNGCKPITTEKGFKLFYENGNVAIKDERNQPVKAS